MTRRSPSEPDGIKRVHVGCGPKNTFPDWWNVDIRGFKGIDEVMDVTRPWPWKDRLDYVYGEHFLEHLTFRQALDFLVEAGNALRIGGRIRLSTPSLEWVVLSHFTFDERGSRERLSQTWAINRAFRGWGHQFLYSKSMLERLLEAVGFEETAFFEYGQSNDPALVSLERHKGESRRDAYKSVWIIEGTRGTQAIRRDESFCAEAELNYLRYIDTQH